MKNLVMPEYKFFFVRFTLIFLLLLTVFLSIFYYNSQSELERRKSNIQVQQKALWLLSAAQEISLDDLMHKADMAMYQAKRQGKNQVYFFNDINEPEAE